MILLNPGPATTSNFVKDSQLRDFCPRTESFGKILNDVSNGITRFATTDIDKDDYCTVLFGSSGTGAVEAVISSVIRDTENLLIISNGSYGVRAYDIANRYKINVNILDFGYGMLNYRLIKSYIEDNKYDYVFVVHSETTTGILNDIKQIGNICKLFNSKLIVDAMSSFGAHFIDMKSFNISYLISSANKNIQGLPGTAFVICDRKLLLGTPESKSYYFDLKASYLSMHYDNQTRFTPPVQSILALQAALIELCTEGISHRLHRYYRSWKTLVDGMQNLGFHLYTPIDHASWIVTCFYDLDNERYNFNNMYNYLNSNGFTIYPGKMNNNTFRIANIGHISDYHIRQFLEVMQKYVQCLN